MVSLKTILTIGGIAGAYFLFKSAGGARGIGSSIGGGISGFQSSLVDSLKFQPFPDLFASKYQASEGTAKETIFYDDSFVDIGRKLAIAAEKDNTVVESPEPDSSAFNFDGFAKTLENILNFNPFPTAIAAETSPMVSRNYSAQPSSDNFFEQNPVATRFSNARTATSSQKANLRSLTGGLLG